ncbi:MAG: double-strand break repair protein AddB [Roseibium sp.]|nr:double-strand break repair protein AddB [Roseibium sp.]
MPEPERRPSVHTIPASVPFLKTLARSLVDGSLIDGFRPLDDPLLLPTATLYLPTRRAARLLPDIFHELFDGRPVLLPQIRPVGDADEDHQALSGKPDAAPLPPAMPLLERQLAMTRLVMAWKGTMRRDVLSLGHAEPPGVPASAADAVWLAADLLALMDEVETEGADWSDLTTLVPEDYARYWQITLDFLTIVRDAWPAYLAERGMMDPKARQAQLIRGEADRLLADPPDGPVIVAGVTGSVPATAMLLKSVAHLPQGAIVLPGLDTRMDTASWGILDGPDDAGDGKGRSMPRPVGGASAHPQFLLKRLLNTLAVSRNDVFNLGDPPSDGMRVRERLVSEAMRPAETSDGWDTALSQGERRDLSKGVNNMALIAARNEADEALSVAICLREGLEQGQTCALVSPDRFLTRRVAAELSRWNIQVDDSAGRPLDQTPPAILAILTAKLAVHGCEPIDLLSLLKHPLARLGLPVKDIRAAARALERGVVRGPRPAPGTEGLKAAVRAARQSAGSARRDPPRWKKIHDADWPAIEDLVDRLAAALAPLEDLAAREDPMPVVALTEAHAHAVSAVAVDEIGSDAELFAAEAGEAFATFFAELLDAGESGLSVRPGDWPAVLGALMAGQAVRRRLPGDPRIQILGPMEARLQHFDRVILGGLNEGIWPQRTRNSPWLNRPMKSGMGLDPPERRIGASAHEFCMGLGARHVVLSRAVRADGAPTVASRWLQRLTTLAGPEETERMETRGAHYTRLAAAIDRPESPVKGAMRPRPKPPLAIRPKQLSVTEIELLIRDPYAIFARHILDLQPVDPIGGEPGAADKGILIHDALARFLSGWDGPFDETAKEDLIRIGAEEFEPLSAFPAIKALWWPRFLRIAAGFVDFEAGRADRVKERYLEVSGAAELRVPGATFELTGRADRIDLLVDGRLAVLDYKTGQVPSQKQVAALLAPQLPLEAAMIVRGGFKDVPADARFAEFLYLQLKGGADAVLLTLCNPKDKDLGELAEDAWSRLETLIAHYAQPDTGYLSRARVMQERVMAGPYDHLARVAEWSTETEGGE